MLQHLYLTLGWILYCFLHSFLAKEKIKGKIPSLLNATVPYRVLYNFFAFITLAILIWFQFHITSVQLFKTPEFILYASIGMASTGIAIMVICVLKYFPQLSGLRESYKDELRTDGIHKYVRHPLYLGTFLFIIGLFLIYPLLKNVLALIIIIIYTLIGINIEEKKLLEHFGEKYKAYKTKVPSIIPFTKITR